MLSGKKVLLGVTGSIAAYKASFLVRLLIKQGAEVRVILTPSARSFVTPLTLATLSKNPVQWEYFGENDPEGKWNNHVDFGLWADLMLIAPATAKTLSKLVSGNCDNLLMGCYLSAKCPVYIAPAMDLDMYQHPSTQHNLSQLKQFGNFVIPAGSGELASGLEGEGRMAEPEEIVSFLEEQLKQGLPLTGKKVLINAGPTYEAIDPVRFIGNHSSGKMGVALAEAALNLGAEVELVLGPNSVVPKSASIKVSHVQSALQMQESVAAKFDNADVTILAAAIADYRPADFVDQKIKKTSAPLEIKLIENPDILAGLGAAKRSDQVLVGFALETQNGLENAEKKLHKKNCDFIVLNSPSANTGFGANTNSVWIIDGKNEPIEIKLKSKIEVAKDILQHIVYKRIAGSI